MKVLYFAWVRTKIGLAEESLPLPAGVETVGQFLAWLKGRGAGFAEGMTMSSQFLVQVTGVGVTALWSGVATWVLLKVLAVVTGLRPGDEASREGLDLIAHGERAYDFTQN